MLTKRQLEDAAKCPQNGLCTKCEMDCVRTLYNGYYDGCISEAAQTALAYREMLEEVIKHYEEMERDAIERSIKALEKQVPQKVKKYKGLNETACPECGIAFGYYEYDDEKFDYCYNCGQKLDWESEVEEG
jgi:hypothetical protein